MKVAIVSSFNASGVLDKKEVEARSLRVQHPNPWITNLAEALARKEVDIHVVTISNEFNQDVIFEKNNVRYVFLKSTGKIERLFSFYESEKHRLHSFLKKENFDVVHGQGLNMFGYYAVTPDFPFVLTIHLYMSTIDRFRELDRIQLIRIFLIFVAIIQKWKTLKRVTQIISISPIVRKILASKGFSGKIYDIENPVHPNFFRQGDLLTGDFCLYIGSITQRKNVLMLVKALGKIKKGKLKIISQTISGEYYSQVRDYVSKKNLAHRVAFLGPKNNDEIVDHLKKALFLVLPSLKEMAPMVISEAMAAGKPVIASAVDGVPYMIREGETGYVVPPGDSHRFVEKMELLFTNPELCQQMGEKARQEAEKRWHPDVIAQKTLVVYETMLSSKKKKLPSINILS